MGVNLGEGFRALGAGLTQIAGYEARREQENVEQLRQENLARLQNGLAMNRDKVSDDRKDSRELIKQDKYFDRLDKTQAAQDTRQSARETAIDKRAGAREAAADRRIDDREVVARENDARKDVRADSKDAAAARQKAIDDIAKIKGQLRAHVEKVSGMSVPGDENASIANLAKSDELVQSYLFDLKDANRRRLDAEGMMKAPSPRNFGSSIAPAQQSPLTAPPASMLGSPASSMQLIPDDDEEE